MRLLDKHRASTQTQSAAMAAIYQMAEKMRDADLANEIAEAYLNETPVNTIAEHIRRKHTEVVEHHTIAVIRGSVYLLIKETVPKEKREQISFTHRSKHAKDNVANGLGVHNEASRRNGGKTQFQNKIGMFDLSPTQIAKNGRKGAFASMETQGKLSWQRDIVEEKTGLTELEYCMYLARNSHFIYQKGAKKGQIKCKEIANALNDKFPNEKSPRTGRQVSIRISKEKKKIDLP